VTHLPAPGLGPPALVPFCSRVLWYLALSPDVAKIGHAVNSHQSTANHLCSLPLVLLEQLRLPGDPSSHFV
jgi:hypothetical protein